MGRAAHVYTLATLLTGLGALELVGGIVVGLGFLCLGFNSGDPEGLVATGLCAGMSGLPLVIAGGMRLAAASSQRQLQGRTYGLVVLTLSLIPLVPSWPIGALIGAFGLWVHNDPRTTLAFELRAQGFDVFDVFKRLEG